MTEDLAQLFERASDLPYGMARVAALEAVVERADPGASDNLAFAAREALIFSYIQAGERAKSFVPFAWCLQQYDADPSRYAGFRHQLLWAFKWQPEGFSHFPEIDLGRITELLDDMERRYRIAGQGMHGVVGSRLLVALHVGDSEAAERYYLEWEATPRDRLSDCAGCVPSLKVDYLIGSGRHEYALRLADPVLQGRIRCPEQPQDLLSRLLSAYVATGRFEDAAAAHRRAYRLHRSRRGDLGHIGRHIEFLARTGNETRALELIEAHLPWIDQPREPSADLMFSAAASLALSRLDSTTAVRAGTDTRLASDLATDLRERATNLAARFDQRNNSTHIGDQTAALLDAEPWVDHLPLTAEERRAAAIRATLDAGRTTSSTQQPVAIDETPVEQLLDLADELWSEGRREDVATLLERYDDVVSAAERKPADHAHYLELRGLLQMPTDPEAALAGWREALVLFDAVGNQRRVQRVRARMGRALTLQGATEEGAATSVDALTWLCEHDDPRDRAGWSLELAQRLIDTDPAAAEPRLARLRADDSVRNPEMAAALHGEALLRLGLHEQALAAFDAALALSRDPEAEGRLRGRRGQVRLALRDARGAVEDFTEALAISAVLGDPGIHLRLELASAQLDAGDPFAAAESGERVLRVLALHGPRDWELYPRRVLTEAYIQLCDWEPAYANAVALTRLEPENQLARLLEQEGVLLIELDRPAEARERFDDAIAASAAAGDTIRHVVVLRRAATLAENAEHHDAVETYRRQADALVLGEEESLVFQRAGLASDRASSASRTGQKDNALALLREAERDYLRIGAQPNADASVVRRVELGEEIEPADLGEIFGRAEPGTSHWFRTGDAYRELLHRLGRIDEAVEIRNRLDERES